MYKEIVPGDLRKLVAESNDSTTGGGARDLRLPWRAFRPVMHRVFTKNAVGRGGKPIRVATIDYLDDDGKIQQTELEYWPPTDSRPTEDRIARIHASPALGGRMPEAQKGRVFVIFTKFDDGTVRCDYAYESDLRKKGVWAAEVTKQILGCMGSAILKNRTVEGYYDFTTGMGFCNAD